MEANIDFYRHFSWLRKVNFCSPANNETYQERLLRLEGDKESLVLQVSVLTDQVEAQGEKIRDLESSLEEHRQKLASTEEMLQQELMSRTSLETQKLDLMDEVSYLKLKLVSMEESHTNTHEADPPDTKQDKAECVVNFISELQEQMCRFQAEISTRIQEKKALEEKEAQQGDPRGHPAWGCGPHVGLAAPDPGLSGSDSWNQSGGQTVHDLIQEVKQLKNKVDELEGQKNQYERKLRATKLSISYSLHVCYQSLMTQLSSLKLTVEHTQLEKQHWEERWRGAQAEMSELQQLLASKDAEIECLQTQLLARDGSANDNAKRDQEYQRLKVGMESLLASNDEKDRRIEELTVLLGQYRKMREVMALTQGSSEEELSGSLKLKAITHKAHSDMLRSEMSSRGSSPLLLSSSPFQRELESSFQNSLDASLMSAGEMSFLNGSWHRRRLLSSSLEELQSGSLQKSPLTELNKYQTLPGKLRKKSEARTELSCDRSTDAEYSSPVKLSPDHDKNFTLIRCRSASAPVLGSPGKHDLYDTEPSDRLDMMSDHSPLSSGVDSGQQSPVSPENRKTHRGIRKLWGKIRRSQSGSPVQLHDQEGGDFKRGGFRATAGPRLARSGKTRDLKLPFSKWSVDQVCDWLEDIGLGQYGLFARRWVSSGQTLLSASPQDLEKELSLKHPLHRKKLQLAIKTLTGKQAERSAELDYIWVTRWLDDIGLPQYKDQFNEGRVDGQMLQFLTVNDLLFLKVTSQLHHLSIKCAIHVLHVNKFNPNCLKRRPGNESQFSPSEVVQWSNHRVMEWLRSVDLAEYAPNLRGSGVHGGLIMLEPRFNADTLAMLLNISPQKTLLRRHLTTNFNNLVGEQAQQEKREYTEAPGYTPLSITAKVKPKKLGFSNLTHLRRRRSDESTDYVCPIESPSSQSGQSAANGVQVRPYAGFRGLSPILDREPARDQVGLEEGKADTSP
ncbi:liprin-beta-2b isoform X2 [Oryzias melastigma]|uniref:liprin-beta-2b isoform X2 n=1 Tax=Oryzias melastigma TaxID=30732 RepID=UPI00168D5D8B|nr:liprin-beta-2b isoform X2 [Oryzias melastigma]